MDMHMAGASFGQANRMKLNTTDLDEHLRSHPFKNIVVRQHGQVLWEWHEGGKDGLGSLYSCTKSILSALVGIAIQEGIFPNVNQPIAPLLPRELLGRARAGIEEVSLKHLLTMTPGLDWPDFDKPYREMVNQEHPLQYLLERPFLHEPGSAYTYNSGGSHLLSYLLSKAAGMSTKAYAVKHLLTRIGIHKSRWSSLDGVQEGGTGLLLTADDLSRFGQLYLQQGSWNGQHIVSESWIKESTAVHHRALSNYQPPIYGHYGYHWWVSPAAANGRVDYYFAFGHGGQYLIVIPERQAVVVIRKKVTTRNDAIRSRELFHEVIWPAIQ
ncbi:serine hydrolase domain-containing protein [Paenibacillus sp. GCM10023252]|uniref:serine hydrolase domain-containing protein n=1 Tax=Paenibacillus sp. GCM10023252 TaxID=3252649 RepID=UPI00361F7DAF